MERLKVIMPIGVVPDGAVVTKKTGEKKYTVHTEYNLHTPDGPVKFQTQGSRLITPKDTNSTFGINAISNEIEVVWHCTFEQLESLVWEDNQK